MEKSPLRVFFYRKCLLGKPIEESTISPVRIFFLWDKVLLFLVFFLWKSLHLYFCREKSPNSMKKSTQTIEEHFYWLQILNWSFCYGKVSTQGFFYRSLWFFSIEKSIASPLRNFFLWDKVFFSSFFFVEKSPVLIFL